MLVVGAGIIGLLATCGLRSLFPGLEVVVVAKHAHQAAAARTCGASRVVELGRDGDPYPALAEAAGTQVKGSGGDAILAGGFPYVVEAVGSDASVTQALRSVDSRGTVLLLGAAGVSNVDLTPVWFKEATLTGSFCHAHDALGPGNGDEPVAAHSIDRALSILGSGGVPDDLLVTHELPLDHWRDGLETAMARAAGAIKVVLRPS